MASRAKEEDARPAPDNQQTTSSSTTGWISTVEGYYLRTIEHAKAHKPLYGCYILVYGGCALWVAYRFRKLRKLEDRVRALQDKLVQERIQEMNAAATSKAGRSAARSKAAISAATSMVVKAPRDATPKPME